MSPPFTEGERVTLTGILRAAGPTPSSFEDKNRSVAAATARGAATGIVSARAERLWIEADGRRVELSGPVIVALGSRETKPNVALEELSDGVVQRVAEASGDSPMPRGAVRFCSVLPGDRVRAAGLLTRGSDVGSAIAYRDEGAPWALVPDPGDDHAAGTAVRLSFDGSPRVRGPVASILAGVRTARRPAAFGVVIATILASGFALSRVEQRPPQVAAAPARPVARFAGRESCKKLAGAYVAERDRENHCERDEDCVVEMRGEQWTELDGCFRFRYKATSPAPADALAQAWLAGGCMSELDLCNEEPQVMCRKGFGAKDAAGDPEPRMFEQGFCVERPPDPVPEDWTRNEYHHIFSLFLPPGYKFIFPPHEDVLIYAVFGGKDSSGQIFYEPTYEEFTDINERHPNEWRPLKIHGQDAEILRTYDDGQAQIRIRVKSPPECPNLWCPDPKNRFYMSIVCPDKAACDRMMPAIQSLRFY
jgi:hypothetical protein